MAKKQAYGNESITTLKGAERVRKRPAVILAPMGWTAANTPCLRSCRTPLTRRARGYGKLIIVTRYADRSIEVEDFGRGCPVDWNEKEQRLTGSWSSARCTRAANTTTTPAKIMNTASA